LILAADSTSFLSEEIDEDIDYTNDVIPEFVVPAEEEEISIVETVAEGVSMFTLFGLIIIALLSGVMYKSYTKNNSKAEVASAADPEIKSNLVEPLL